MQFLLLCAFLLQPPVPKEAVPPPKPETVKPATTAPAPAVGFTNFPTDMQTERGRFFRRRGRRGIYQESAPMETTPVYSVPMRVRAGGC